MRVRMDARTGRPLSGGATLHRRHVSLDALHDVSPFTPRRPGGGFDVATRCLHGAPQTDSSPRRACDHRCGPRARAARVTLAHDAAGLGARRRIARRERVAVRLVHEPFVVTRHRRISFTCSVGDHENSSCTARAGTTGTRSGGLRCARPAHPLDSSVVHRNATRVQRIAISAAQHRFREARGYRFARRAGLIRRTGAGRAGSAGSQSRSQ